jgi:hypothetical protein
MKYASMMLLFNIIFIFLLIMVVAECSMALIFLLDFRSTIN